jgi:hypothetical protein
VEIETADSVEGETETGKQSSKAEELVVTQLLMVDEQEVLIL